MFFFFLKTKKKNYTICSKNVFEPNNTERLRRRGAEVGDAGSNPVHLPEQVNFTGRDKNDQKTASLALCLQPPAETTADMATERRRSHRGAEPTPAVILEGPHVEEVLGEGIDR